MSDLPVDLGALEAWMDSRGLGGGPLQNVGLLKGGSQNILLRFERDGASFVMRRGPQHLRAGSNDAMRREMRVLAAIGKTSVPHARFIDGCLDERVLGGAVFFLMEEVDGVNATVELAPVHEEDREVRREMGFAAVDAATSLGSVDYVGLGLADLGHPDGFLERQVPRWAGQLESYRADAAYPAGSLPIDDIARWLESNRPRTFRPGLMHGDFHLANMLFAKDGPNLAAVVDWEMCTVGDPLLDLGWLMATWPDDDWTGLAGPLAKAGGLPTRRELLARYAAVSTRDLSSIGWYEVLACLKLAAIVEGTYARALAGMAPMKVGASLHRIAKLALARARLRIAATP